MNDAKYIGLDVHQATISAAVLDSAGKLVMEATLETKAETILQFLRGLRGSLHVTLEEGTWATWLHDLLKPHVTRVLVSDPRKNDLGRDGNRNDRRDARELAELLYRDKGEIGVSRRAWPANLEGTGTQLPDDYSRSHAGDDAHQSNLSKLGHSLCRPTGLRLGSSRGMAGEAERGRGAPAGGILSSAV